METWSKLLNAVGGSIGSISALELDSEDLAGPWGPGWWPCEAVGFRVFGRDGMVPPGVHDRVPKIRWLIIIVFLKIYVFLTYKIAIN